MKRLALEFLMLVLLAAWVGPTPVQAASKYKACTLLTAAELEAVVRAKMVAPEEGDVTVTEGPFKGEVVSHCNWSQGATYVVMVSVMRAARTPEQRAAGLAVLRDTDTELRQQGWKIDDVTVGGVACATYRPPAGLNALTGAACGLERKGYALSVAVLGSNATPQQVKGLVDRAVARLP